MLIHRVKTFPLLAIDSSRRRADVQLRLAEARTVPDLSCISRFLKFHSADVVDFKGQHFDTFEIIEVHETKLYKSYVFTYKSQYAPNITGAASDEKAKLVYPLKVLTKHMRRETSSE